MMPALGGQFLDELGNEIPLGGGYLKNIKDIDLRDLDSRLDDIKIEVACDVNNPLYGGNGLHMFMLRKKVLAKRW